MEYEMDDLEFDDKPQDLSQEEPDPQQPVEDDDPVTEPADDDEPEPTDGDDTDVITKVLNAKGISDPNQIKFLNDDGETESRSWNELSSQEQFNILSNTEQPQSDADDLDDDEAQLINNIRLARMTVDEYANSLYNKGVQDAQQQIQPETAYAVDDLTDEEIFAYDMKARINDITDDEVASALLKAQEDPEIYQKQVAGIRQEYKQLEDERNQQMIAEQQAQEQEQQQQFQQNVINSINNLNSIGSLDLVMDQDDKEELADFMLGSDQAGEGYLNKTLNDPDSLTRMAWFALKGPQVFNEIQDYYNNQITQVRQQAYQQGLADANNKQPRVAVSKATRSHVDMTPKENNFLTIDDLD